MIKINLYMTFDDPDLRGHGKKTGEHCRVSQNKCKQSHSSPTGVKKGCSDGLSCGKLGW